MMTMAESFNAFLENFHKNDFVISAPTMWGKTTVSIALEKIIPTLINIKHQINALTVITIPNNKSIFSQFQRKETQFNRNYDLSIQDHEMIENNATIIRREKKQIDKLIKKLKSKKIKLIILINDEAHIGQKENSLADYLEKELKNIGKYVKNIHIGATSYEAIYSQGRNPHHTIAYIENGYRKIENSKIQYHTLDGYQENIVPIYCAKKLKNIEDIKAKLKEQTIEEYAEYIIDLLNKLKTTIPETKKIHDNYPNMIMAIRLKDNKTAEKISEYMKKSQYKIINYTEDAKSIKEELEIEFGEDYEEQNNIIVLLTGRGRYGDEFPKNTSFIDFTDKTKYWQACEQGFLGRATGYWKNGYVLLSNKNYNFNIENPNHNLAERVSIGNRQSTKTIEYKTISDNLLFQQELDNTLEEITEIINPSGIQKEQNIETILKNLIIIKEISKEIIKLRNKYKINNSAMIGENCIFEGIIQPVKNALETRYNTNQNKYRTNAKTGSAHEAKIVLTYSFTSGQTCPNPKCKKMSNDTKLIKDYEACCRKYLKIKVNNILTPIKEIKNTTEYQTKESSRLSKI